MKFAHSLTIPVAAGSPARCPIPRYVMIVAAYPEALCSRSVTSRFATTASCASPAASQSLRFVGYLIESLQLKSPTAGQQDLPDVYHCESFPGCLDLYPGCLSSALARFFLLSFGLPQRFNGSTTRYSPCHDFCTDRISGLQSFLNVQASKFACHPGRSHRCGLLTPQGSRGVYFRAPYELLPPHTSDMLAV